MCLYQCCNILQLLPDHIKAACNILHCTGSRNKMEQVLKQTNKPY